MNTIGAQLNALRKPVTRICVECGEEFTGLVYKNTSNPNICQICKRKATNARYYRKHITGEQL